VRLEQKGAPGAVETKTTSEGTFAFPALGMGSYVISAEKSGVHSHPATVLESSKGEHRQVDLIVEDTGTTDADSGAASLRSAQSMEFSDKPNFTVAGVVDWTAVGGHGSDTILRTSEALARETVTLKPEDAKRAPANPGNEYELTLALKDSGDLEQAHDHVQKLLAREENGDLHRLAGELDEKLGDPLAAVHEFEQAVRLDPSEQNYFEWGSELLLHRAVWQAEEVFRKGSEAYPKSARMLAALGAALFAGARYDEAALRLCDASDLNPADTEPYIFMGKIELAAPNPLPCIEQKLARFAQQEPRNSLANYFYAMAIWKRQPQPADPQALRQVETLLTKAVEADSKCGDAYLELGVLSSSQRNLEKAAGFYLKAIEANPQLGEAHYRLGVAYDRLGEAAKAKHEFQLHDELEKQQAAAIEEQRREVKQFLIVLEGRPSAPPAD
jgi:tetratricopeptide (TPR) repeat protein